MRRVKRFAVNWSCDPLYLCLKNNDGEELGYHKFLRGSGRTIFQNFKPPGIFMLQQTFPFLLRLIGHNVK